MLRSRKNAIAGGITVAAIATVTVLLIELPQAASGAPGSSSDAHVSARESTASAPASVLTASDIRLVDSLGSLVATKAGTVVTVQRGSARDVWNAVSPDVTTVDTTPEVMSHEFLLVTATDNVQQAGYKGAPGFTIPKVTEVQIVIDAATGHVLETTRLVNGSSSPFAPASAADRLSPPERGSEQVGVR